MMVSLFPKINITKNGADVELLSILEDIRIGKWRDKIEALRALNTEEEQKQYKNTMLPYFTVSATFTHRDEKGINKHSGFACLDADKKHNMQVDFQELRQRIQRDSYTFSCFLSCRGWDGGLAIIVKIPDVKESHEASYRALKDYYEGTYGIRLDKTSNVAWPRYISWDPDLYLNQDSEVFEEVLEEDAGPKDAFPAAFFRPVQYPTPTAPSSHGVAAMQLAVRKIIDEPNGTRHHKRRDMAYLCGGYIATGLLSEHEAQQALESAVMQSSPKSAWRTAFSTIRSGLRKGQERPILPESLQYMAYESRRNGEQKELVAQKIAVSHGGNAAAIQLAVDEIYAEQEKVILAFWDVFHDEKKDLYKLQLSHVKYSSFLHGAGFRKYCRGKEVSIVRIENNVVYEMAMHQVQTFIMDYLEELPFMFDHIFKSQVIDQVMKESRHFFDEKKMGFLKSLNESFIRDEKGKAYFFFRNGFVITTEEGYTLHPYAELPALVWEKQICDRDFAPAPEKLVNKFSFCHFLHNSSGQNYDRLHSLFSLIGYMLHGYKDPSKTKVGILVDQAISENPSGGTGKSLIFKAISKLVPMVVVDCKMANFKDKFWTQEINEYTRVVFFDDWDGKRIPFEILFVMATGEMKVNKLYQGQSSTAYELSPKIGITTNDMIAGNGDSHARRKFEFEIAPYYSNRFSPKDDFGHNFFDDWNENEWNLFDNLMMICCRTFLGYGLVETAPVNLNRRKLLQATQIRGQQSNFAAFMDSKLKDDRGLWKWTSGNMVVSKPGTFDEFKKIEGIPENVQWFTSIMWDKWLKLYAQYEGLDIDSKRELRDDYGNKYRAAIFTHKVQS